MSRASEAVTAAGGWRKWFTTARGLPSNASPAEKANRGREFEAALVEMLSEAKLQPRKGYRPIGEEIDGSFWLDGRTYLFEAKWTSAAHPASSLYQFKGKVEGKLTGTVGLFFSMSGYSPDAVQALVAGKNLNLVLFDDSDINLLFEEEIDIAEAIRLKVRAAAESGTPYIQLDAVRAAATRGEIASSRSRQVFVEGRFDRLVLEYLRNDRNATEPVQVRDTAGPRNMPRAIDAMLQFAGHALPFVAVLEKDEAERRSGQDVQEIVNQVNAETAQAELLWIPGSLEECLGLTDLDRHRILRLPVERVDVVLEKVLEEVDLEKQISLYPDLGPVLKAAGIPM
ncbi:hypothetical protein GS894_23880 [Rhodococcus hoagii]|nr:hypothetical protein [Prescottella equi]NKT36042.1 hypothetical protein [Prescottella equi]NKT37666.1 hypothetical protein [Prescottella equi]NKT61529.1 hypothetical protein [Prescottella equi]NKT66358.1 hypothetical protein [Prescottella equi]